MALNGNGDRLFLSVAASHEGERPSVPRTTPSSPNPCVVPDQLLMDSAFSSLSHAVSLADSVGFPGHCPSAQEAPSTRYPHYRLWFLEALRPPGMPVLHSSIQDSILEFGSVEVSTSQAGSHELSIFQVCSR